MTVLSVSDGELRRLEVLRDVDRGGLPVSAAARLLERSDRQVWRLLKAFRSDGAPRVSSPRSVDGRATAKRRHRCALRCCGSCATSTLISGRPWPLRARRRARFFVLQRDLCGSGESAVGELDAAVTDRQATVGMIVLAGAGRALRYTEGFVPLAARPITLISAARQSGLAVAPSGGDR